MTIPVHAILVILLIIILFGLFYFYRAIKMRDTKISLLLKEKENIQIQKESAKEKLEDIKEKKQKLSVKLEDKQKELIDFALNIIQKNTFLEGLKATVNQIKGSTKEAESLTKLNQLSLCINQHIALDKNRKLFQLQLEEANREFYIKLSEKYPQLTERENRLSAYIRLKLSSKEIASLLNIASKSVEINRYRLRKKFGIDSKTNLSDFISEI